MLTHTRKLLLASGFALAAVSAAAGAGSTTQDLVEARQESQIWTTYALSPHLRANQLEVSVDNGKATLTGRVEEDVNKDLAKQIALGVSGIKEVDNQIVVQNKDYNPPARSSDRSFGEVVDDATITSTIKSKLVWGKSTAGFSTDVDTKFARVTLTGKAETPAAKELAGRLAMNTRGVVAVDNQLVVQGTKPDAGDKAKATMQEAGHDVADSWITTKVKSTFMYSSNVDGGDITVNTADGIVTLSGKVDSGAERDLAIELAKNVRGVKSVSSKGLTL